jgi:hypothetical protein
MTSQQTIESVTLNSPEDWETWDTQFKAKAVASELWDLINPIAQEEVPKPVAPKVEQYDKRAERSDTHTQISEQVDQSGRPSNTSELTTAARAAFQLDWNIYTHCDGLDRPLLLWFLFGARAPLVP